jgi:hypothetical protein
MPLKRVTIGKVVFEGDTDKELFAKYMIGTVSAMADRDGVMVPYECLEKLGHLIDSISPLTSSTALWMTLRQTFDIDRHGAR